MDDGASRPRPPQRRVEGRRRARPKLGVRRGPRAQERPHPGRPPSTARAGGNDVECPPAGEDWRDRAAPAGHWQLNDLVDPAGGRRSGPSLSCAARCCRERVGRRAARVLRLGRGTGRKVRQGYDDGAPPPILWRSFRPRKRRLKSCLWRTSNFHHALGSRRSTPRQVCRSRSSPSSRRPRRRHRPVPIPHC